MSLVIQNEITTTLLTDPFGVPLIEDMEEPHCGSILMVGGWYGTAWQRMFADGQWHPSRGGTPRKFKQLLKRRNVILIYEAKERVDG
jgi:hypothetical protein